MRHSFAQFAGEPVEVEPFRNPERPICPSFNQVIEPTSRESAISPENPREEGDCTEDSWRSAMTPPRATAEEFAALLAATRRGDRQARDELLRRSYDELAHVARKMFRGFPGVKARMEASDVLHNALIRLLSALPQVQLSSAQDLL